MTKRYRLSSAEMEPLADGRGACFATDMITVEGHPVRFAYRETPDNPTDSGRRFVSGLEDGACMNDPAHQGIYDFKTIGNYDRTLLPLLDAPEGSAFAKAVGSDVFVGIDNWSAPHD